jgi:hypothetical protein
MHHASTLGIGRRFIFAGVLGLAAATMAAPGAYANEQRSTAAGQSDLKQIALLATADNSAPNAIENSHLGRAPYICTPSGFGHLAHCFLRSSLKSHQ